MAPVGRFRHLTLTPVAEEESVTGYVAVEPALTVADVVVKDGGRPPPESTSNCDAFEVPPPGAEVCTVIDFTPPVAIWALVTCAASSVGLMNCVFSADAPK